jgi:hypothetical protein
VHNLRHVEWEDWMGSLFKQGTDIGWSLVSSPPIITNYSDIHP